jgi:D-arabinose 1-dehydrogenase-like Zn-dependent alcohol dehydrogenase
MLAFVIPNPGDRFGMVMRVPKPSPYQPGYVLRAQVCNTDLEILQGYMGFHGMLGHEFVGIVEQVNGDEVTQQKWIGKQVCGADINICCASCSVCNNANNLDQQCSQMSCNHCHN